MKRYDRPPLEVLLPTRQDGTAPADTPATYYGSPMIKPPHWRWYISLYFFIGGIAAGAGMIGALAALVGGPRHRTTVRHARYLSVVLAALCPIPLILDLGRPARFHHMLRVVKLSSPLNLGTFILTGFGLTSGALAARQAAEDSFILPRESLLGRLARALPSTPLNVLHALLGIALGGYTGTLLAVTAVPLWAAAGVLLGPLFLATAVASGAAALVLVGLGARQKREALEEIETVEGLAALTQLGVVAAREALVPARIKAPLARGRWAAIFRFGAVGGGMIGPLALRLIVRLSGRRVGRALTAIAATLTLLGALAERFALVEAGKLSAKDPLAYQELTRGAAGKARPTPAEQASRASHVAPYAQGIAARDTISDGALGDASGEEQIRLPRGHSDQR
jgi:formate-dependent nitrite reductase membrane component NrfD